jgi:CheY-like chemotaxis protein
VEFIEASSSFVADEVNGAAWPWERASGQPPICGSVLAPMTAGTPRCHHGVVHRLVIVDDHESFRVWAREVLTHEGFEVVGVAEDGRSAIELVRRVRPDVVLLDIQLPDCSGFEVAQLLTPDVIVVLTSSRTAADYGSRIAQSPATGFVPKSELDGRTLSLAMAGASP